MQASVKTSGCISDFKTMLLEHEGKVTTRPVRVITFGSVMAVISATVLIDTLILTFAFLILWSVGGYLAMSLMPFAIFSLLILVPTVWACVRVAMLAFEAETDPANN
jgi:hypothetical protein